MRRSSRCRLALFAAALCLATLPLASKDTDHSQTPDVLGVAPALTASPAPAVDSAMTFALSSFPQTTMRFQKTQPDSASGAIQLSPRTRAALQESVFNHALRQTMEARDFSPGTWPGAMLDSLVSFAGTENVTQAVKSYRPSPAQHRVLLRAIRDRAPLKHDAENRSS